MPAHLLCSSYAYCGLGSCGWVLDTLHHNYSSPRPLCVTCLYVLLSFKLDILYIRCAAYPNLTPTCHLVADPKDPFCCEVPECTFNPVNGTFSGFGYPTAAPGVITGGSVVNPTPRPVIAPTPQPIPGVSTPVPSAAPTMGPGQTPAPTFKGNNSDG